MGVVERNELLVAGVDAGEDWGMMRGGSRLEDGGRELALEEVVEIGKEGGREDARRREEGTEWGGGCREVEELPAELDVELERERVVEEEEGEEKEEGGRLAVSFLEPGGELQREPRGETETPESQLSFRLRLPPPRPAIVPSSQYNQNRNTETISITMNNVDQHPKLYLARGCEQETFPP